MGWKVRKMFCSKRRWTFSKQAKEFYSHTIMGKVILLTRPFRISKVFLDAHLNAKRVLQLVPYNKNWAFYLDFMFPNMKWIMEYAIHWLYILDGRQNTKTTFTIFFFRLLMLLICISSLFNYHISMFFCWTTNSFLALSLTASISLMLESKTHNTFT